MKSFYDKRVKSVRDLKSKFPSAKYIAVIDDSITAMGHDYGPPDPPPSMETTHFTVMYALESEQDVKDWIEYHMGPRQSKGPETFQILKVDPVQTSISLNVQLS